MKKLISLLATVLFLQQTHAQQAWTEDFDGTITFSVSPANSWQANTTYHLPGSSLNNPQSYHGLVPNSLGDSAILTTAEYDCSAYGYIYLRFAQICKISPKDTARVEYRVKMGSNYGAWMALPASAYLGRAANYHPATGFNAASYSEWVANDDLENPTQTWWKEELFDLRNEAGNMEVQFRFIIKHGMQPGTHISYGWLLENFQLTASAVPLDPPSVKFITPFVADTVYNTGPWVVNAEVKSNTAAPIERPWLKYTTGTFTDSVLMTAVTGDFIWKASIPQFAAGTTVTYSITGQDSAGNTSSAVSKTYLIMVPPTASVPNFAYYLGNSTTSTPDTANTNYTGTASLVMPANAVGACSRTLYFWDELTGITHSQVPVLINSIAYKVTNSSGTLNPWSEIKIYMKGTNDSVQTTQPFSPIQDGATLVYQGPLAPVLNVWISMQFQTEFSLPPGSNLMVYLENIGTVSTVSGWRAETNSTLRTAYGTGKPTMIASLQRKPVARFGVSTVNYGTNSAALESIDIRDTVAYSANVQIPIIATIKNKGSANLVSVDIAYSINGVTIDSVTILPKSQSNLPLSWDMSYQDTLGYYTPKNKGFDTIAVWISEPNGMTDSVTYDDRLEKVVYGGSDIVASFIQAPTGNVFSTGPYPVRASIVSLLGTVIDTVPLYVTSTLNSISTVDTLYMQYRTTDNMWITNIPQKAFGTEVDYAIRLTDILGNNIELTGNYSIVRLTGTVADEYKYAGTNSGTLDRKATTPITLSYSYSYSRQLYRATELNANGEAVVIDQFAWGYAGALPLIYPNQRCYFQAVDSTYLSTYNYFDPIAEGATLVWEGTFSAQGLNAFGGSIASEWAAINLPNPFILPAGKNLLVYWINHYGAYIGSTPASWSFHYTPTTWGSSQNSSTHLCDDDIANLPQVSATVTARRSLTMDRPNARFHILGRTDMPNAVVLKSINTPSTTGTLGQSPVEVNITIQNMGSLDLTYCIINWSVNGQAKTPRTYNRMLLSEFSDTVNLGMYTPTGGQEDTIVVWVSQPNNLQNLASDTLLRIYPYGCGLPMTGTKTIENGNDYNTLNDALASIRSCGVGGNVTLLLRGNYNERIDLSNFSTYLGGYSLTITSAGNHPDSAKIQLSSGAVAAITLNNASNITLKNITVDVSTLGVPAIEFAGSTACSNVVIRDCKLLGNASSQTNAPSHALIYKANGTAAIYNIAFINNVLDGGYYGFHFYGGTSSSDYATNIVFDSNRLSNQCYYGVYSHYTSFTSCNYNAIKSRTSDAVANWYGLRMNDCSNSAFIGNKISQENTSTITSPYGMYLENVNATTSSLSTLIANNEIRLSTNGTFAGIYARAVKARMLHNSIYIAGNSGAAGGIEIIASASNLMEIKNNNIVMLSSMAYPIRFDGDLSLFNFDYNNLSAPSYVGRYGASNNIPDIAAWQQQTGDMHSVKESPQFLNTADDLQLTSNRGLTCPIISPITTDIDQKARGSLSTTMGAYEYLSSGYDLMLLQVLPATGSVTHNQTVSLNVTVVNSGTLTADSVRLGYRINGGSPQFVTQPLSPALTSHQSTSVAVGTFTADANAANAYNVIVWVEAVNGEPDPVKWNDTARITYIVQPLVKFVPPYANGILNNVRSFDVRAEIFTGTGAPTTPPQLHIETVLNGNPIAYDIPMNPLGGGIYTATLDTLRYNTNVVYSLSVSDNIQNNMTITDSVFINMQPVSDTTQIIGTGSTASCEIPVNLDWEYSWSRQLYLYREVCPDLNPMGTMITKIAWQALQTIATGYSNQTCFVRATSDTAYTEANRTYPVPSPLNIGFTQAWTGTLPNRNGWIEVSFNQAFFLPAGMNLEIMWEDRSNRRSTNADVWTYTSTPNNVYRAMQIRNGVQFPDVSGGSIVYSANLDLRRPNIQIAKQLPFEPYENNNLALFSLITPGNSEDNLCSFDDAPIQVVLANTGQWDYDFSLDSVKIHYEIIDPSAVVSNGSVTLNTGILKSGTLETIDLTTVSVKYSGEYEIKVYISSPIDNFKADDTLAQTIRSGKIALAVDEDFSGDNLPFEFVSIPLLSGTTHWEIIHPDTNFPVQPDFGTGVAVFTGNKGVMAKLSTRQLELYNVVSPKLEFWYYHDTSSAESPLTQTTVSIVADGTSGNLFTLYKKDNTRHGWIKYESDLTDYVGATCLLVEFESMVGETNSAQYLDRVFIYAQQNLALDTILISPEIALCDFENKEVQVVIYNSTGQRIDFAKTKTQIRLEIRKGSSVQTFTHDLDAGMFDPYEYDTIPFTVTDFDADTYNITAWITTPIDNDPLDDTTRRTVEINPDIELVAVANTDIDNCLLRDITEMEQTVTIINKGNFEVWDIPLVLEVHYEGMAKQTLHDTLKGILAIGDSQTITFSENYIVPNENTYNVVVRAILQCDAKIADNEKNLIECVDLDDIGIVSLEVIPSHSVDNVGDVMSLEVRLENTSPENFHIIMVNAHIISSNPAIVLTPKTLSNFVPGEQTCTFSYTVPSVSDYKIKVFIDKVDSYQANDTSETASRITNLGMIDYSRTGFVLGQNIPNPAKESTRIAYVIPNDGQVVFTVYTITGQTLHIETQEANSGENNIEFNTANLANGIYYYSIEYNGERLTKKMTIRK